jgi:hypothetical protein
MKLSIPKRSQELSPAHARAKVQEKKLAERIGGTTTKGSGNQNEKGDVRLRKVTRIECKTTKNKSFSVSVDLLDKLDAAVFGAGELPFFEIELLLGARKAVVMTGDTLDMLIEMLKLQRG